MSDWQSVCIGDIANIPKKQSVANPQAIELLTVRLYAKGVERTGKYPRATERGRPYFAREAGEILIGRQNFHNGGIGIVGKADHGLICSNAITSLIPSDQADKDFLFYLLSNSEFRNSIQKQSEGTGQSEISETKILSLELALPPLPEQKKIAEILSGIDRVITQSRQSLEKLALLERATIKSTIDRIEKIDSNCRQLSAGEICRRIFVGIASSTTHAYTDNTGVPMLRNQNIKSGTIDGADLVYISREFAEEQKSKRLLQGDVITARTGYPGDSAVVGREFENCHSFTTLISRVETDIVNPEYYSLYLNSPQGKAQVAQLQAGGAQENLNVGALAKMIIPVPDLDTQISIVKASEEFSRTFRAKESVIRKNERLKDALSSDLLSGRKRVSI